MNTRNDGLPCDVEEMICNENKMMYSFIAFILGIIVGIVVGYLLFVRYPWTF